jgi:hypothetical protein
LVAIANHDIRALPTAVIDSIDLCRRNPSKCPEILATHNSGLNAHLAQPVIYILHNARSPRSPRPQRDQCDLSPIRRWHLLYRPAADRRCGAPKDILHCLFCTPREPAEQSRHRPVEAGSEGDLTDSVARYTITILHQTTS